MSTDIRTVNSSRIEVKDVISDDPDHGAGLFAKQKFDPGDIVCMFEGRNVEALDTARLSDTCYYCYLQPHEATSAQAGIENGRDGLFQTSNMLQVCTGCRVVRYCDRKCQSASWQRAHKQECKFFAAVYPRIPPNHMRALYREVVSKPTATRVADFTKFDKCSSHVAEFIARKDNDFVKLVQMSQATRVYTKTQVSFDDVLKMYCILKINSVTLMTETFDPLGLCFEPTIAKMNHSCQPNVYIRFTCYQEKGTRSSIIEVTPLRKIQADEELTISYIEQNQTREARQKELQERYFFTCTCSRCAHEQNQLTSNQSIPSKSATLQQKAMNLVHQADSSTDITLTISTLQEALHLLTTNNWPRHLYPYPQVVQKLAVSFIDARQFLQAMTHAMVQHFDIDPLVYSEVFHPVRLIHLYTLVRLIGAVVDDHIQAHIHESGNSDDGRSPSLSRGNLIWWRACLANKLSRDASLTYKDVVRPSFRHVDGLFRREVEDACATGVAGGVTNLDDREEYTARFVACRKVMDAVYREWGG